ncbi:hypothetical protein BMS3Abin17_01301 [archaeon BMS3Abin17]|nr:hypothetical protein BMS3Abin17_01301 [archaeon BMS3Abin17]
MFFMPRILEKTTHFSVWMNPWTSKSPNKPHPLRCGKTQGLFDKTGYSDWSASASFYSLYHLLLALVSKKGFESRNQSCTFALVEEMADKKEINLTKDELREIYDKDVTKNLKYSNKILDIRENMQYSVKTFLEEQEFEHLKQRTKFLFDKLRKEIEK